jgi:hypothetical protein
MGSAQDRKIEGGVDIKRGTVDVAAPLASARRTCLRLRFGPYHIGPSCSSPFSYSTMISPTPRFWLLES